MNHLKILPLLPFLSLGCTPDIIIVNFEAGVVEVGTDTPVDQPHPDVPTELPVVEVGKDIAISGDVSVDIPSELDASVEDQIEVSFVESTPEPSIEPTPEPSIEPTPEPSPDASPDASPEVGTDVIPDREAEVIVDVDPCPGRVLCASTCVDLRSDPGNCGGCSVVCNLPGVAENGCSNGTCSVRMCRGSLQDCDRDPVTGCEVDTSSDLSNCGRCGAVCPSGSVCSSGSCVCPSGTSLCGGSCIPTLTDPQHCGGCAPCPTPSNSTASCSSGICGFTCNRGYIQDGGNCVPCGGPGLRACTLDTCSESLTSCSGICRQTQVDRNHCGACGRVCAAGFPCVAGVCMVPNSCTSPLTSPCAITEVERGVFDLGDVLGVNSTPIQRRVTVSPIYVDTYEVTVERFRAYWNAGHPVPSSVIYPSGSYPMTGIVSEPGSGVGCTWRGPSTSAPINCVNWTTAQAFCVWDGGRLPTEAEWEWAARKGSTVPYPWGGSDPEDRLVCWSGSSSRVGTCSVGGFLPGVSPDGIHDMAGGVYEWMADSFQNYTYMGCWSASELVNPLCGQLSGLTNNRVVRGGSWETTVPTNLRSASRISRPLSTAERGTGFRCVRSR